MSGTPKFAEIDDQHVGLRPQLSVAEIDGQQAELLPARTVMKSGGGGKGGALGFLLSLLKP
jgi:hypothetical protein